MEDTIIPIEEQISALAQTQCTYSEISASVGVSVEVLRQDYDALIKAGWDLGKASLKQAQFKKALEGNPQMLTWLGKQYLGQSEKADTQINFKEEPYPAVE